MGPAFRSHTSSELARFCVLFRRRSALDEPVLGAKVFRPDLQQWSQLVQIRLSFDYDCVDLNTVAPIIIKSGAMLLHSVY